MLESYDVRDRVELVSGDFTESIPVVADCYVLKHIVHDWYDDKNETILGNPVRGNSTVSTKLSVRLIPVERTWRFDLVAQGTIDSRTRTSHGAITFSSGVHEAASWSANSRGPA